MCSVPGLLTGLVNAAVALLISLLQVQLGETGYTRRRAAALGHGSGLPCRACCRRSWCWVWSRCSSSLAS